MEPIFYNLSLNAFYADDVNSYIVKLYAYIASFFSYIEKYICEGISYFSSLVVRIFSLIFSKMQTGNPQSYLSYSLFVIMTCFGGVMLVYALIIYFSEVQ